MNDYTKKIIIAVIVIGTLVGAGYGAFKLYNWAIQDATKRIKAGVTEGVGGALNPTSWFK